MYIADEVTEKKQQEELLRRRRDEFGSQQQNAGFGRIGELGSLTEINNPLTVVLAKTLELRVQLEQLATNSSLVPILDKVESNSRRISGIIHLI